MASLKLTGSDDKLAPPSWFSGNLQILAVCGTLALLLWPILFGNQTLFYRDLYLQYIGTGRLLHSGMLPGGLTWDPFLNGGQPLLGNPNQFVLYPSRVLYLVMSPASALNWEIALHFLLGAVGAVVLARRLGLGRTGSAVSGLAYSLSGISISIASHLGRLMAYHWVPWILLAVHAGLCEKDKNSWRWQLLVPVFFLAQWLTGTAESVALTAVTAVVWVGVLYPRDAGRFRTLIRIIGLVALGAAMAAIQIVPAAEMVYRSDRAAYAEIGASADWSLHPLRTPEILVPGYLGPVDEAQGGRSYWGSGLFNRGFPLIVSIYLGVSVALFSLLGWIHPRSDPRWRTLRGFFLVLAGGAIVFAFGEHIPLIGRAWATIPGFNVIRYPVKMLLVVGLPVSLLAGRGIDLWLGGDRRVARRAGFGVLAAAVLVFAVAWWSTLDTADSILGVLFPNRGQMAGDGLGARLVHVGLTLAALALVGLLHGRVARRLLATLAMVVVAADLIVAAVPFLPMAPRRLLQETPEMVEKVRSQISDGRFFRDRDRGNVEYPYVEDRAWASADWVLRDLSYSVASTFFVPMVYNFDIAGLADRRMAHLRLETGEVGWDGRVKLFLVAGVEAILTRQPPAIPGLELVAAFDIGDGLPLFLYRLSQAPALVRWVAKEHLAASGPEALTLLTNSGFDPTEGMIRELEAPSTRPPLRFLKPLQPRAVILNQRIWAQRPGHVVAAVPWHPDLVVRVDGRWVPAERVNYAFSGFEVPAGRHDIELTFVSRTVFIGAIVSGTATLIWGLFVGGGWWSNRRHMNRDRSESQSVGSTSSD